MFREVISVILIALLIIVAWGGTGLIIAAAVGTIPLSVWTVFAGWAASIVVIIFSIYLVAYRHPKN